ncbi:PAS domain-containing protein [Haliangium ochraceum]|uniref:PAS fold-4 domain-containing protein n=1 Tax=Haliangium ochraceum (strain DSM 14365 / JCM 11303 / SMP-2) TaxID=502025 RepID=D0LZM7_HALO1|nr:PAS domain-containing protein [Haliangium ochraceum]ACY18006.1 hypothetical protein Hoch_5523 [Haliangium ochraceum DSM 14365]
MSIEQAAERQLAFDDADLYDALNGYSAEALDSVAFGVVRMNSDMRVIAYNRAEAENSGLRPAQVLGKHVFLEVAPCLDNEMVAAQYRIQGDLDTQLDYVLAFFMRPTPVRLRLLKRAAHDWSYLCVKKR